MLKTNITMLIILSLLIQLVVGEWEIRTCSGCKLNRLPEVRSFIKNDAKKFRVPVKYIHGRNPDLVKFSPEGAELEIHDLSGLNNQGILELLNNLGIVVSEDL